MIREQLQALAAGLARLAQSGNVRSDGDALVSDLRVSVGQLIDQADTQAATVAAAVPDPVDVRLSDLAVKVEVLSDQFAGVVGLVDQLAKLAGDLQAATVKG
jgi:hypothetical protein